MLASAGLGFRSLSAVFMILSGEFERIYPAVAAAAPSFIVAVKTGILFDIFAGILLLLWPVYLGWLERKLRN